MQLQKPSIITWAGKFTGTNKIRLFIAEKSLTDTVTNGGSENTALPPLTEFLHIIYTGYGVKK